MIPYINGNVSPINQNRCPNRLITCTKDETDFQVHNLKTLNGF